jgi:ubiquinone/menaquinone biosynthesis C-methylase UbiE
MSGSSAVETHYARPQLEQTILQALARAGHDLQHLKAADLAPLDEFHVGGLESTQELTKFMELRPGLHLLDVGCGVGGPARYFASEQGCRVTGVDLTEEFVRTAESLTKMTGLEKSVTFRRASALELPFEAGSFDGAYMIHVGMNLADKAGVFREVGRVLRQGARFTIFDILRATREEFAFPVPWALSEGTSFVQDRNAYREALRAAGFTLEHERDRRQFAIEFTQKTMARAAEDGPPILGLHLLMGEKAPVMLKNILAALQSGALEPVELVATR